MLMFRQVREVLSGMSEAVAAAPQAVRELRIELTQVADLASSTQKTAAGGQASHATPSVFHAQSTCRLSHGWAWLALSIDGCMPKPVTRTDIMCHPHSYHGLLVAGMASAVGATGDALEVQAQRTAALAQRVGAASADLAAIKDTLYGPGAQPQAPPSSSGSTSGNTARHGAADTGAPGSVSGVAQPS